MQGGATVLSLHILPLQLHLHILFYCPALLLPASLYAMLPDMTEASEFPWIAEDPEKDRRDSQVDLIRDELEAVAKRLEGMSARDLEEESAEDMAQLLRDIGPLIKKMLRDIPILHKQIRYYEEHEAFVPAQFDYVKPLLRVLIETAKRVEDNPHGDLGEESASVLVGLLQESAGIVRRLSEQRQSLERRLAYVTWRDKIDIESGKPHRVYPLPFQPLVGGRGDGNPVPY